MSKNIFLTGFPGFISSRLVPELLKDRPEAKAFLLVQPKFSELSRKQIVALEERYSELKNRLIPVEGDLTHKDVLYDYSSLDFNSVSEIFNLAAVYDLRVKKELAYKVNVDGTKNLVEFSKKFSSLQKFHHISTCYVAGWHTGNFNEDDFDKGQTFKNYYEETKFISEQIIRENSKYIPYVIYRPSIVIGDSRTGETNKFDGPYPIIFLISRLPKFSIMTQIGTGVNPVNLIPVDYVVSGISKLSTIGEVYATYHLCDPNPLTQNELVDLFSKQLNKKLIPVKVKPEFVKSLLKNESIANLLGLYPQMIDYFDHPLYFRCEKTLAKLNSFNIKPPKMQDYIQVIIDFALKNKTKISKTGLW